MAESYLTTDIIVIIVLTVLVVLIGICAFLMHFYWTKIGIAEIWNTAKWSSMRSSIYQKVRNFSRPSTAKSLDQESLAQVSIHSDDVEHLSLQKKRSSPMITAYHTPTYVTYINSNQPGKLASVMPYSEPARPNYHGRTHGRAIDNTGVFNSYSSNNNRSNDLASKIQKQRF
ncbi:unnamed protein product [Adineta ricciae]|nr:unnamed protein product [Adineta ricciae]